MTLPIEIGVGLPLITIAANDPQSPVLNVPAQGPRGRHGGLAYGWDIDTAVTAPAVGRIKINSADFATATKLSINVIDADGNDVGPEIAAWGDSQNPVRAIMRLMKVGDPDSVVFFHVIDGGSNHTTWWEYDIAHVRSAGGFDAATSIALFAAYSGYKGDIGPAGPTGTVGDQGVQGLQGDPGPAYGITFLWSNSVTTNADPGVGFIRFNNATLASVTQLALDDQSSLAGNPDVSTFMLMWDDSSNTQKGYLTITEVLDPTTFITFSITSITDLTGYLQINGAVVSSNGTFTNGGVVVVQFARTGDVGAQGPQGSAGSSDAGIQMIIDGGPAIITTGLKAYLEVPFACTINRWTLLADASGSIVVDLWKTNYAGAPPVVGNVITASAKPTISGATKAQSSTLTGWTTSLAAGDILAFNVNSVSGITRCTVSLKVTKS